MVRKEYNAKKKEWSEKTEKLNEKDEKLANEISKRLMLLGNLADMLDNCVTDIAELTKGTPYELRREVKQEYNRLVPQVRKFRHVTFDVFTDLNVEVLADNGIEADEADVAEASDLNYKMQLALYDKLGNTLWDTKKYLYLMNCIYGLSSSRTYEIRK
jgi:hypothetical protein